MVNGLEKLNGKLDVHTELNKKFSDCTLFDQYCSHIFVSKYCKQLWGSEQVLFWVVFEPVSFYIL